MDAMNEFIATKRPSSPYDKKGPDGAAIKPYVAANNVGCKRYRDR
jgi:hypothetical protein